MKRGENLLPGFTGTARGDGCRDSRLIQLCSCLSRRGMRFVFFLPLVILVALLAGAVPSRASSPPQPTGLNLLHRSGQTFVTWKEQTSLTGEKYRVYRYDQPITAFNIGQAALLREVARGSGRFFADRYNVDGSGTWRARYVDRFVIRKLGKQLPGGTGLLVWTLAPEDFGGETSGPGYYAVTTVSGGIENVTDFSSANARGPIDERVNDPAPVEILRDSTGRGHVYTQFMDLRNWNPTFHAPNPGNLYYGLSRGNPAVAGSIQYAYTYTVGEPDPVNCPSPPPQRFPVVLNLHGWGDNTYGPDPGGSQYYCAYEIRPIDVSETWWFGFARGHDYRVNSVVEAGDTVVNFTEARVLRMLYDFQRDPAFLARIDSGRVYVYGHSMGGSGALAFTLRYPNVFAASYASEPMTNYRTATAWKGNLVPKWGRPVLNLPVRIFSPGNWADGLQRFNGTGVWDWQNHQANFRNRIGDEFVPFGVAHGRADDVIPWPTQGRPAYGAFDASRHAWGGAVTDSDHTWLGFRGLPPDLAMDESLVPFAGMRAVRDETVPGLSRAEGNSPLPPPDPPAPPGEYNQTIEWSSSWDPWDDAPIDTAALWRMSLRTTDGSTQTVNVTPRRTQHFAAAAGRVYRWENRKVSDNALVSWGRVEADADDLLTVPGFRVTPQGNRLRITSVRTWADTTPGASMFSTTSSRAA